MKNYSVFSISHREQLEMTTIRYCTTAEDIRQIKRVMHGDTEYHFQIPELYKLNANNFIIYISKHDMSGDSVAGGDDIQSFIYVTIDARKNIITIAFMYTASYARKQGYCAELLSEIIKTAQKRNIWEIRCVPFPESNSKYVLDKFGFVKHSEYYALYI